MGGGGDLPCRYKTVVIDPPWPGPGEIYDPRAHVRRPIPYSTMTGVQLAAIQVPKLVLPGAQLWLWVPSRHVGDAFLLLQLWGFRYRGLFVWLKPLGTGRSMRHQVEFLLWGVMKGSKLPRWKGVPVQVHRWKHPGRGHHSEKPAEAYVMIRTLSEPKRVDLFARQRRPGFDAWGIEVA